MGRKTHHHDREYSDLQKLKFENKKLKREVSRLRKVLARVEDLESMEHLTELVELQRQEDHDLHEKKKGIDLKQKWGCHKCQEGLLLLYIFNRLDGVFYYRRCNNCGNKTRLKKYHEGVEGLKPEDKPDD